MDRVYRLGHGLDVPTLKTETLSERADGGPKGGQAWNYSILGAKGIAPAVADAESWAESESLRLRSEELLGACASLGIKSDWQLTQRVSTERAILDTCQQLKIDTKDILLNRLFGQGTGVAGRFLLEACSRAGVANVDDLLARLLPPEPTGTEGDPSLARIWRDLNVWRQSDVSHAEPSTAEPRADAVRRTEADLLRACADLRIADGDTLRRKATITPAQKDMLGSCGEHRIRNASALVARLFGEDGAKAARVLLVACEDKGVDSAETLLHRLLPSDPFKPSLAAAAFTAKYGGGTATADPVEDFLSTVKPGAKYVGTPPSDFDSIEAKYGGGVAAADDPVERLARKYGGGTATADPLDALRAKYATPKDSDAENLAALRAKYGGGAQDEADAFLAKHGGASTAVAEKPKPLVERKPDAFDSVFGGASTAVAATPSADTIDDLDWAIALATLDGTAEDLAHFRSSKASIAELGRIWQEVRRWREAHDGRQKPEPRPTSPKGK